MTTTGNKLTQIRVTMDKLAELKRGVGSLWLSEQPEDDAPEHIEQGIIDIMIQIGTLQTKLKEEYNNTCEGV